MLGNMILGNPDNILIFCNRTVLHTQFIEKNVLLKCTLNHTPPHKQ